MADLAPREDFWTSTEARPITSTVPINEQNTKTGETVHPQAVAYGMTKLSDNVVDLSDETKLQELKRWVTMPVENTLHRMRNTDLSTIFSMRHGEYDEDINSAGVEAEAHALRLVKQRQQQHEMNNVYDEIASLTNQERKKTLPQVESKDDAPMQIGPGYFRDKATASDLQWFENTFINKTPTPAPILNDDGSTLTQEPVQHSSMSAEENKVYLDIIAKHAPEHFPEIYRQIAPRTQVDAITQLPGQVAHALLPDWAKPLPPNPNDYVPGVTPPGKVAPTEATRQDQPVGALMEGVGGLVGSGLKTAIFAGMPAMYKAGKVEMGAVTKFLKLEKELQRATYSAEDIENELFRQTGLWRGYDGGLRKEIPDVNATLDMENLLRKEGTLPQILKHDELYDVYPELKNIKVQLTDDDAYLKQSKTALGYFSPFDNKIVFRSEIQHMDPRDIKEFLLHEIQHKVQYTDNSLVPFTNPKHSGEKAVNNLDRQLDKAIKALPAELGYPPLKKWDSREYAKAWKDPETKHIKEMLELRNRIMDRQDEFGNYLYHRNPTEIEARLVQERSAMDESTLKEIPPEYHRRWINDKKVNSEWKDSWKPFLFPEQEARVRIGVNPPVDEGPPAGFVRLYRGESKQNQESGGYYTTDKSMAKNHANGRMRYVDVPEEDAAFFKMPGMKNVYNLTDYEAGPSKVNWRKRSQIEDKEK